MISLELPRYGLDWTSGKVYGKDISQTIVQQKFDIWDYVVDNELMNSDKPQIQMAVGTLLEDNTIFAYAFLEWEGQPIKMRYYQDVIMNDMHKRIDVEAANQQGKSFSLCTKGSVEFLKDHGKNYTIGLISKSMSQNSMNMRMVRQMLKNSKLEYTPGNHDSMSIMTRDILDDNGNVLYTNTLVCSVASTSALGFPFDLILLDEFEFWENPEGLEYVYDQVFEPRTFNTKGQIIIYSNPNGKNFVSENLHTRKAGDEYEFHVYNINFMDNPQNTREEFEKKRGHVHPIIFASTMAAERTESEGSALTDVDIESTNCADLNNQGLYALPDNNPHFFLDLGFVSDQSALVGGFKHMVDGKAHYTFVPYCYPQMYDIRELWGKKEGEHPSVPSMVKRYGDAGSMFDLDITGKEGNEILAQEAGLGCNGTKMSGPWKAKWYERFISLCKQKRVRVARMDNYIDGHNKDFAFQARSLRISTKTNDGRSRPYPLYHPTSEKDHDDIVDAIIGCLSLIDDELGADAGMLYVPGEKEQLAEDRKKEKAKKKIDDTPYDDEIEKAVQDGYRDNQIYGGMNLW